MNQNEIIDLIKTTLEVKIEALNNKIAGKDKIIELQDAQLADYRRMIDHYQRLLDRYSTPERSGEMNLTRSQEVFNLEMIELDKKEREIQSINKAMRFLQFLERNKIISIQIPHTLDQYHNLYHNAQNEPPKIDDSLPQTPGL